jgi:hypothetical protein
LELGCVETVDFNGRTIWITDAHRGGKRFIVHADEKLTAFVELEAAIRLYRRNPRNLRFNDFSVPQKIVLTPPRVSLQDRAAPSPLGDSSEATSPSSRRENRERQGSLAQLEVLMINITQSF